MKYEEGKCGDRADGLGSGLTITVSSNISPGNYTITIKVSGENVPEKIFTSKVIVVA